MHEQPIDDRRIPAEIQRSAVIDFGRSPDECAAGLTAFPELDHFEAAYTAQQADQRMVGIQ
jgi:hypothetical protein